MVCSRWVDREFSALSIIYEREEWKFKNVIFPISSTNSRSSGDQNVFSIGSDLRNGDGYRLALKKHFHTSEAISEALPITDRTLS